MDCSHPSHFKWTCDRCPAAVEMLVKDCDGNYATFAKFAHERGWRFQKGKKWGRATDGRRAFGCPMASRHQHFCPQHSREALHWVR